MERLSDEQLVEEARALQEMVRTPGWAILKRYADSKLAAIKEALCKADPTNAAQIASLQAQARECGYFFALVDEGIKRGREAQERLDRKGGSGNGYGGR